MSDSEGRGLRALIFDGGDVRCLSQLDILDAFLYRVQWRKGGKPILPFEYFDIIGAVGPASLIVIMLVILRMSVQEAKQEFFQVWSTVFADDRMKPAKRTLKLRASLGEVFERYNASVNLKLLDSLNNNCKGFICALSPERPSICRKFRTYPSPEKPMDITVIDAVIAACAAPNRFVPLRFGMQGQEQDFIGAEGIFNNPIQEAIMELHKIYTKNQRVACILSLGYGSSSVTSATSIRDKESFRTSTMAALQAERAAEEIDAHLGNSRAYFRFSVARGLESLDSIPADNVGTIEAYSNTYLLESKVEGEMSDCVDASETTGLMTVGDICKAQMRTLSPTHGVPPLCTSFVERPELIKAMTRALFNQSNNSNRIMVLSGMAGSGKTQIISRFSRLHSDRFQYIYFVDASSTESLENGIIAMARSLGANCQTVEEAKSFLITPIKRLFGDWLLVLDNGDDPKLDFAPFLPLCEHGFVVITTRNPSLEALSPPSHVKVDILSETEAIAVLKNAIFPPKSQISMDTYRKLLSIVKELGCLPVAIVQAGSFIKQRRCLEDYLTYLRNNRRNVLNTPADAQLDHHCHGIYAALDVTLPVLSTRAKKLLGLLACFNYTGFPLPLISRAANRKFCFEPYELIPRPPRFQETIDHLFTIFCPDGSWNSFELEELLLELEKYSLVTKVKVYSTLTLRFHPLVRLWALDQIVDQEKKKYEEAALRLLLCGTSEEDEDIYEFLLPHLRSLSATCNSAHVNDLAGIAKLARWLRKDHRDIQLWEKIYTEVTSIYGLRSLYTSRAQIQLALAYSSRDFNGIMMAQDLVGDVVNYLSDILPPDHPEKLDAMTFQSQLYDLQGPYGTGVMALQRDAVKFWHEGQQEYQYLAGKGVNAADLDGQLEIKKFLTNAPNLRGRFPTLDLKILKTYGTKGIMWLLERVITYRMEWRGACHIDTLASQATLARLYERRGEYDQARMTRESMLQGWITRSGHNDWQTARCREALARLYQRESNHSDAMSQWESAIEAYSKDSDPSRRVWARYATKCQAKELLRAGSQEARLLKLRLLSFHSKHKDQAQVWIGLHSVLLFTGAINEPEVVSPVVSQCDELARTAPKKRGSGLWVHLRAKELITKLDERGIKHRNILFIDPSLRQRLQQGNDTVSSHAFSLSTAIHSIGLPHPEPSHEFDSASITQRLQLPISPDNPASRQKRPFLSRLSIFPSSSLRPGSSIIRSWVKSDTNTGIDTDSDSDTTFQLNFTK